MAVRYLTSQEKEMIAVGLSMRRNYIETGSTTLGAADIANVGAEHARRAHGAKINALSGDQMKLIIASRELESRIYSDEIIIYRDEEVPHAIK